MLTKTEEPLGKSRPRYLWMMVAVATVLISVLALGGSGSAATSYDAEELRFLRLINEYRQQNGAGPLLLSDTLAVAAEHHSKDMARYDFFAHNTLASSYYGVGFKPWDRMAEEGYTYNTIRGENLATGTETAEESFQAWRESPSHNAAMLDGRYRVIGIARVYDPDGAHAWYWTTDFGGAIDPTSHAPGEGSQDQRAKDKAPKDGAGIENGAMNGDKIWEQEAKDGAELILEDDYARLGGYDEGADELRQKGRVGKNDELTYDLKVESTERENPSDWLRVRITNKKGERIAVLRRHADEATEGWRHHTIDLSRFAGRTVYVSFRVRTDEALLTSFYLDDVALERNSGPAAGP